MTDVKHIWTWNAGHSRSIHIPLSSCFISDGLQLPCFSNQFFGQRSFFACNGAVWTQNPGNARGSPKPRGSPSLVRSFAVQLPPSGQSKHDWPVKKKRKNGSRERIRSDQKNKKKKRQVHKKRKEEEFPMNKFIP